MLVRKSATHEARKALAAEDALVSGLTPEQDRVECRMLEGVRLSFRLPEALHRRLKLHAVRSGSTLVGTIAGWVREHTPAA